MSDFPEYPAKVDVAQLARPLPVVAPGTVPSPLSDEEAGKIASSVLQSLSAAVAENDARKLAGLFHADQAYWRDMVALTAHIRAFSSPDTIAPALLAMAALRTKAGGLKLDLATAKFMPASPVLQFIDCRAIFKTAAPATTCNARLLLLPVPGGDGGVSWKIWILTTWIKEIDAQPEDQKLLLTAAKGHFRGDGEETLEIDVLIIGGGSAGMTLAARLKAMGVDSVILDKNARVGDNWGNRYDWLKLHTTASHSATPFLGYIQPEKRPHYLTKDELAEHQRTYAETFGLNVVNSATILSSKLNTATGRWTVRFRTRPEGNMKTVICRELVQATGFDNYPPNIPQIADAHLYGGKALHTSQYRNAKLLASQGIKSVIVVGAANTAFDVVEDCHHAGLQTAMVVRSPTWFVPLDYTAKGAAVYEQLPADAADVLTVTLPLPVLGEMVGANLSRHAALEPERYAAVKAAGFPVLDCTDPSVSLVRTLYDRRGGHYVDTGDCVRLIGQGEVKIIPLAEPVAFTPTGLRFSDGSAADADAVIWATGSLRSHAARRDLPRLMLGGGGTDHLAAELNGHAAEPPLGEHELGPDEIAARLDAQVGLDAEGEVRGLWKRQVRVPGYWVMMGDFAMQRWWSRVVAQQIAMSLAGVLPPAYRETPSM